MVRTIIDRWKQLGLHPEKERINILALSGGGARGLAHVGVIKAMERYGWYPDLVTGTSMGSLIGALYALEGNAGGLEKRVVAITKSDWFKDFSLDRLVKKREGIGGLVEDFANNFKRVVMVATKGKWDRPLALLPSNFLLDVMEEIFADARFEDVKVPFVAVATDLYSGEDVELTSGLLKPAIAGSCSIPGVFTPVPLDEKLLVDGSITRNIPIPENVEKEKCHVIAIDVLPPREFRGQLRNPLDVMYRTEEILENHINEQFLARADEVISPPVREVHLADFGRLEELIDAGEKAAVKHFEKKNRQR